MTTQKQARSNRKNATFSTGPKSDNGKAVVKMNALKHGVFSKQILINGESQKDFEALKQEFYVHLQPQGLLEMLFWERALAAAWRLSRVTQMESMLINHAAKEFNSPGIIDVLRSYDGAKLSLLWRYEMSLDRVLFRSLAELKALQASRQGQQETRRTIGFVPQNLSEESIDSKVI